MKRHFKKFNNYLDYEQFANSNKYLIPNVSLIEDETIVKYNKYENIYLTFKILTDGDIVWKETHNGDTASLSAITISYSRDNGLTWNDVTSSEEGTAINVHAGEKILFKGNNNNYGYLYDYYNEDEDVYIYIDDHCNFEGTTSFDIEGNIMSLIYGDNFRNKINLGNSNIFSYLFSNSNVVNAKNLKLPATTLAEYCYSNMFGDCSSLVSAPELPATTLAEYCYNSMFYNCSSLANAPELPATTLAEYCYSNMFGDCSSLVSAPELPATTLAEHCYGSMFYNCSSLVSAPELPATTLAESCYDYMFAGCSNLESAPELPATTLAEYCYNSMFGGCSSLVSAPELPATTLAEYCYIGMFGGCSSLANAPELPATTLAEHCYGSMFYNCSSLANAPELPATTLVEGCYGGMFSNCSNLNYIKAMFMTTPSVRYTGSWVDGVPSTGTFVKNTAARWNVTGRHGIPIGWTVETASA